MNNEKSGEILDRKPNRLRTIALWTVHIAFVLALVLGINFVLRFGWAHPLTGVFVSTVVMYGFLSLEMVKGVVNYQAFVAGLGPLVFSIGMLPAEGCDGLAVME